MWDSRVAVRPLGSLAQLQHLLLDWAQATNILGPLFSSYSFRVPTLALQVSGNKKRAMCVHPRSSGPFGEISEGVGIAQSPSSPVRLPSSLGGLPGGDGSPSCANDPVRRHRLPMKSSPDKSPDKTVLPSPLPRSPLGEEPTEPGDRPAPQ